ncbi:MAG: sulfotransferase [Deltaproteobacteria bacterium]|nr:sulfotransferase [Deltaproteobacteria bacterium]
MSSAPSPTCDERNIGIRTWHPDIPQVLQWLKPGRRVLKTPSRMRPSEALLGVCPDTRVIQTHRDPLEVLASLRCLLHTQSWTRSDL